MKKYMIVVSFIAIATSIATAQERDITVEITKVSSQANTMKPSVVRAINNLEAAKRWLQQKINCLVFEEEQCSKTDLLMTNYALGFAMGAYFPITMFADVLHKSGKIDNVGLLLLAQFTAEFILGAAGIKGVALRPYINTIKTRLTTVFLGISDVAGLIQQTPGAPLAFIKALGKYLAMNAQCVWSESYCQQSLFQAEGGLAISPFGRRLTLYYWLGIASGIAARTFSLRKMKETAGTMMDIIKEKATRKMPTFVAVPENF